MHKIKIIIVFILFGAGRVTRQVFTPFTADFVLKILVLFLFFRPDSAIPRRSPGKNCWTAALREHLLALMVLTSSWKKNLNKRQGKKQILLACNALSRVSVSPIGTSRTPESETNIRVRENNYEKKYKSARKTLVLVLRLERNKEMEEIKKNKKKKKQDESSRWLIKL